MRRGYLPLLSASADAPLQRKRKRSMAIRVNLKKYLKCRGRWQFVPVLKVKGLSKSAYIVIHRESAKEPQASFIGSRGVMERGGRLVPACEPHLLPGGLPNSPTGAKSSTGYGCSCGRPEFVETRQRGKSGFRNFVCDNSGARGGSDTRRQMLGIHLILCQCVPL